MKISEVTVPYLVEYLKADYEEETILKIILDAAKKYVTSYTGLTEEELESYEDCTIALLTICQDMYDNRSFYVDNKNVNKLVECILGMHSTNLL